MLTSPKRLFQNAGANHAQSSFVPLNVEIESESEDEIDDSKEIQVYSSNWLSVIGKSSRNLTHR